MSEGLVPIPAVILDRLLPTLKDTELRILLLVARQTVGRGGKPMDWLAHSQLKTRTGRASEAISAALDSLIQRGLLIATDTRGELLSNSEERRRFRGKVLYQLGPLILGKPKTTDNNITIRRFRFIELAPPPRTSEESEKLARQKSQIRERLKKLQERRRS
jgi:hypothetical protein